jgi:hypothetical protein
LVPASLSRGPGTALRVSKPKTSLPAFYALSPGGWRDLVTILHPPYTAWHLSYVAVGAALAPTFVLWRLGAALGAFFLALGVACHALDELTGRPLGTQLTRTALTWLAVAGLGGAVAIGTVGAVIVSLWLIPLVVVGTFLALAYNLELFDGRFHTDMWFAVAWGGFPAFTGWFVEALDIRAEGMLIALACSLLSVAQRRLSTPARELRRRTITVVGTQSLGDGKVRELNRDRLLGPLEGTLSALWQAMVVLAVALVVRRL